MVAVCYFNGHPALPCEHASLGSYPSVRKVGVAADLLPASVNYKDYHQLSSPLLCLLPTVRLVNLILAPDRQRSERASPHIPNPSMATCVSLFHALIVHSRCFYLNRTGCCSILLRAMLACRQSYCRPTFILQKIRPDRR